MIVDPKQIITERVKSFFANEASGHDWWHTHRVRQMALYLALHEGADPNICELAALLHDVADWKFNTSEEAGLAVVAEWLDEAGISLPEQEKILTIISQISYKGAGVVDVVTSIEASVVQDADRLDAIGAIGIARAFAFGGHHGRPLYEPDIEPEFHQNAQTYKTSRSHTINHFYEKLLLLADRMKTHTAQQIAKERHRVMLDFLSHFFEDWDFDNGNKHTNAPNAAG